MSLPQGHPARDLPPAGPPADGIRRCYALPRTGLCPVNPIPALPRPSDSVSRPRPAPTVQAR